MAIDETIQIHESLCKIEFFNHYPSPWLRWGWVVPGMGVALVVGLVMAAFLWRLPRAVAAALLGAGALFVFSAMGMEMVGSKAIGVWGGDSLQYLLCYTVEELGEMVAIAWYIRTVVRYAGGVGVGVRA